MPEDGFKSSSDLILYVWPARWDLASFDSSCLAAILYLQFAFPGHFFLVEVSNPDQSPSGQLPYLTHFNNTISPLPSIISYISRLNPEIFQSKSPGHELFEMIPALDVALSPLQKQQAVAWTSWVDSSIGGLVTQTFYSWSNFNGLTGPTLVSILPWPQRLYVPGRLREVQRPRLEAVLLWDETEETSGLPEVDRPHGVFSILKPAQKFKSAFYKERVLEQARAELELLSRLLPDEGFIYGRRPSTLDIIVASYILLVLHAPLPDPILKTLLLESYPRVVTHACLVHAQAFPSTPSPSRPTPPVTRSTDSATAPRFLSGSVLSLFRPPRPSTVVNSDNTYATIRRGRWTWSAVAVVGMFLYLASAGFRVVLVANSGREEEEKEENDTAVTAILESDVPDELVE